MFWSLPPGFARTTYRIQWNATTVVWSAYPTAKAAIANAEQPDSGGGGAAAAAAAGGVSTVAINDVSAATSDAFAAVRGGGLSAGPMQRVVRQRLQDPQHRLHRKSAQTKCRMLLGCWCT
jgi:hypothetical protein